MDWCGTDPNHEIPMAILDRLKEELDRAGKVAQEAFDEGKTRLDAFRERQLADKAAQALGYAVYRAKQSGTDLDIETRDRLTATLETHDASASRLEGDLERARTQRQQRTNTPQPPGPSTTESAGEAYNGSPSQDLAEK